MLLLLLLLLIGLLVMMMVNQLGANQLLKHADLAQHVSVDVRLFGDDLFDK